MIRFAAVLLLLGSSACSMDLVSVEVETQEICVQGMNVSFVADENGPLGVNQAVHYVEVQLRLDM